MKNTPKNGDAVPVIKATVREESDKQKLAREAREPDTSLGLLLCDLLPGEVYACRLSFLRVLVVREQLDGPDPKNFGKRVIETVLYGIYYNPVYGTHARMELRNHLLMPISKKAN